MYSHLDILLEGCLSYHAADVPSVPVVVVNVVPILCVSSNIYRDAISHVHLSVLNEDLIRIRCNNMPNQLAGVRTILRRTHVAVLSAL